jgi:hypothetical protein
MKRKDMDCQEKHQRNGHGAVENQNRRDMIQNHPKQAGGKRNYGGCQKQPALCAQFLSVSNGIHQHWRLSANNHITMGADPVNKQGEYLLDGVVEQPT